MHARAASLGSDRPDCFRKRVEQIGFGQGQRRYAMNPVKEPLTLNDMARPLALRNGDKAEPTFSAKEMDRRQDNLRRYLVENNIDAGLLTSQHQLLFRLPVLLLRPQIRAPCRHTDHVDGHDQVG